MKKGDYVTTPRFLNVKIEEVFSSIEAAKEAGFVETTHYENSQYGILGRSLGLNRMEFAAYKK